jgi:cyclophilin family peptidyl-prolyl cis-trans isomerase
MKLRILLLISIFSLLSSVYAIAEPQRVLVKTSMGEITLELDAEKAPKTVANFLGYLDEKSYDGTIFHRVIPDFMIQGGGLGPDMQKKPTREPVENEAKNGLKNVRGSVAMARTGDPHSATAQFFINLKDNDFLDYPGRDGWGYTVFGKVTQGMDVVDGIARVRTGSLSGRQNVPRETVMIQSVTRIQ